MSLYMPCACMKSCDLEFSLVTSYVHAEGLVVDIARVDYNVGHSILVADWISLPPPR